MTAGVRAGRALARPVSHSARIVLPTILLGVGVVLGGGGSPAPWAEFIVEIAAVLAIGFAVMNDPHPLRVVRTDPAWGVAVGAVVAFPLLQLVPLPPAIWASLAGRTAAADALGAVGRGTAWLSWSMLPDAGIAAVLALLPALALALFVARLSAARRVAVVGAVAALGAATALVGLVQFIRGPAQPLSLYADVHPGFAIGFFANRNAQADLIAVTLIAGTLLFDRHRDRLSVPAQIGAGVALLVILASGVATGSRMGMAMLLIPVILAAVLAGRHARVPALAMTVAAVALIAGGTALDRVVGRAGDAGNRTEIWGDSLLVARAVAPFGAGMGSFVPLYAAAERLEHVQPTFANRAHNDYLELAIEGGAPALALLTGLLVFFGRRVRKGWHHRDADRRLLARFAGLALTVFMLHSSVDYPLRTLTLLSIAGVAIGVMAATPDQMEPTDR